MSTVAAQPIDLSLVDAVLERRKGEKGAVIPVLQEAQEAYGFLPREVLSRIADAMEMPFSQVYGVATFYSQFYLTRRGRNIIKICDGTACHVRGAGQTVEAMEKSLRIRQGETTEDYQFTLEVVYCLGACALAPVAVVNEDVKGRCTSERLHRVVSGLRH